MDSLLPTFINFIQTMDKDAYVFLSIGLLFIFLLVYLYFIKKEKKKLSQKLKQNLEVYQKAFNHIEDGILILSDKNEIIYLNQSMITLLALEEKTLLDILPKVLQVNIKKEWISLVDFFKNQETKSKNGVMTFPQLPLKNIDNNEVLINLYLDRLEIGNSRYYTIFTMQNLTDMHQNNNMLLQHQLTEFPNQIKALQDLPILFSKIHIEDNKIALILLSLDNFSSLRAMIGFHQSNDLMITFANYLNRIVSEMNISIYHTFDNHFLLTVSNVESADSVMSLVNDIQERLATFYKMENSYLHITVSSGIALYPDSGSPRTLLNKTYKALSQAQKEGVGKVIVYNSHMGENKYDELSLHNDMQGSLDRGEFKIYYQPIVSSKNKEVVAAEALVRWMHPDLGLIAPNIFIGIMEKTGFIIKLGRYVLEEVLKQQKRWEVFKFKDIEVSINVSMVEIATGEFVEYVEKQLSHHQVNPEKIKFEITETMAMISEAKTIQYFQKLKRLGVGIALDDFGIGYTSFTYLKKFPTDSLKIDSSLIEGIMGSKENQRIVHAMIELGHNMGLKVVVEGVETKNVLELLISYGCDYLQGYYFSRPVPVFEFQKLLRDEKFVIYL